MEKTNSKPTRKKAAHQRVLFLTMTSGVGHNAVAANVKQKFDEKGFETKTIDMFAHDPRLSKMLSGFGFKAMFRFPRITNMIWRRAKHKEKGLYDRLIKKVNGVLIPQINEFAPDIIISSHVAGQILTSVYADKITKPFSDYFIVTDYDVPPTMKPERCKDSFIVVPTIDFKRELQGAGYSGDQLLPFGIPINEKFYKELDKDKVLAKLNLPDFDKGVPTVLIMGGGKGFGKIAGVVERLALNPSLQLITVCGKNEELKEKIDFIVKTKAKARVYNFGFCTNVDEFMTIAHFSVGKAGGISSTEAIAKGLQIVSFKRVPNPELANLLYLESKGLAKSVRSITQLEYFVAVVPGKAEKDGTLVEYSAEKILCHAIAHVKEKERQAKEQEKAQAKAQAKKTNKKVS